MKRKQKRYKDYISILSEINDREREIKALLREAEDNESEGHRLMRSGMKSEGELLINKAIRIRTNRIEYRMSRLQSLKEAMSAHQTETFGFMGGDRSVTI